MPAPFSRSTAVKIATGVLGRVGRATLAYLPRARRDSLLETLEPALRAGIADTSRAYGFRKPYLDTYVRVGSTPAALAQLDALLDSAEAAGAPLRAPTRWAIVTALLESTSSLHGLTLKKSGAPTTS